MEEDFITKRTSSRNYFLDNISMIPDEKTYMAIDISSRKRIGKLDESFVLNYGFEGAKDRVDIRLKSIKGKLNDNA